MARVSNRVPTQPKRQTQSKSNTEGQEKEETQSESKPDDAVTKDKSTSTTSTSTDGEDKAERKKCMSAEEKAQGKRPMEAEKGKQRTRDINEIMYGPGFMSGKAKGIVIGKPKKSETDTGKSKRKAPSAKRGRRRKIAHTVRSSYCLRSQKKGTGVDVASEFVRKVPANPDDVGINKGKGKAKEQETDVFHGSETDSDAEIEENQQELCKRKRKETNSDDDSDTGGAQTNVSSLA